METVPLPFHFLIYSESKSHSFYLRGRKCFMIFWQYSVCHSLTELLQEQTEEEEVSKLAFYAQSTSAVIPGRWRREFCSAKSDLRCVRAIYPPLLRSALTAELHRPCSSLLMPRQVNKVRMSCRWPASRMLSVCCNSA